MKSLWLSLILSANVFAASLNPTCGPISTALDNCRNYVKDLEKDSTILKESIHQAATETDAWKKEAVDESPSVLPWYAYASGGAMGGALLVILIQGLRGSK